MIEACKAVNRENKGNISKIARQFGVSRRTLSNRVRNCHQASTTRKPVNKVLEPYQEEALIHWLGRMRDFNMSAPPGLLEAWANRALARAGKPDQKVSKMWAYRFMQRLPKDLKLGPVKRRTKGSKRIQAEDAGLLAHWYVL